MKKDYWAKKHLSALGSGEPTRQQPLFSKMTIIPSNPDDRTGLGWPPCYQQLYRGIKRGLGTFGRFQTVGSAASGRREEQSDGNHCRDAVTGTPCFHLAPLRLAHSGSSVAHREARSESGTERGLWPTDSTGLGPSASSSGDT